MSIFGDSEIHVHHNALRATIGIEVRNTDLQVNAIENFWGVIDENSIKDKIGAKSEQVIFAPWLESAEPVFDIDATVLARRTLLGHNETEIQEMKFIALIASSSCRRSGDP